MSLLSKDSSRRSFLFSLLSALLLSLPWLVDGVSLLVLVGLAPLLVLQRQRVKRFLWWAALTFVLWIAMSCFWVGFATPLAFAMVPVVGMTFMFVPFALWHKLTRSAAPVVKWTLLITLWLVMEAAYSYGDISFPWLTLGNGFARGVELVQWYSITGVFGGSLWALISNVVLSWVLCELLKGQRNMRAVAVWMVVVVVPVGVSLGMWWGFEENQREQDEIKVAILQPNIDPYGEKFSSLSQSAQTDIMLDLAGSLSGTPDYYVAPETALSSLWLHQSQVDEQVNKIREFITQYNPSAEMVIGASTYRLMDIDEQPDYNSHPIRSGTQMRHFKGYNSALWIDSSEVVDIYHKAKLVVGAELLPYPAFFNGISNLINLDLGGFSGNLARSTQREVYDGIGTAICYEALYSEFCTEYIKRGARALFVISNDGWWGDTPGYHGLFHISRLRAIENRRWIARSANTGISGIIDPQGRVIETLGWDERGAIEGVIYARADRTFYSVWGDVVIRISFYVMMLMLLSLVTVRYRNKMR